MSYNLPAGVTPADIDRHFGGNDAPDDTPYIVDRPLDIHFEPMSFYLISDAKRAAESNDAVVIDADKGEIVYSVAPCGDYADVANMLDGRCDICVAHWVDSAPESPQKQAAYAWLRDRGIAKLPFVGAALPKREERLANLTEDDEDVQW